MLRGRLGNDAGLLFLLLSLEFAPRLVAWHGKLRYPDQVTQETLKQIAVFESNYIKGEGVPGMYEDQLLWLATYLVQPYVRLGRFEYQLHHYQGGVRVWKRKADSAVIALSDAGKRVDERGLLAGKDVPVETPWTTQFAESDAEATGSPVDPSGHIERISVTLAKSEWAPCLRAGDTVLDLHIPAGGAMDWDSMVHSLMQAVEFFARHHSDSPCKALVLGTWFMDPQLADLLPADANLLRLQRSAYLYPTTPDMDGLWFVFLRRPSSTPIAQLPEDSSLRKALKSFLEKGGVWHGGGCFLLPEHMADLRENRYRELYKALVPSHHDQAKEAVISL